MAYRPGCRQPYDGPDSVSSGGGADAEYEAFACDGAEGRVPYFQPERGTGQGDTSSPATWVVFFDIVLRALEMEDSDPGTSTEGGHDGSSILHIRAYRCKDRATGLQY